MCCTACCPHFDKLASWCQAKCSDRMMLVLNLLACAMILVCVAFRFVYMNDGSLAFFFIVLSVYLAAFTVALVLAEFKVERVRTYINFLDTKFGRGVFMIFLAMLILENRALEVILFLCIVAIGIVNMIVGCKQGSDGKKAIAERRQEELEANGGQVSAKKGKEKKLTAIEQAEKMKQANEKKEQDKEDSIIQMRQDMMMQNAQKRQSQQNQPQQEVYDLEAVDRQYYGGRPSGQPLNQDQQQYYQNDSQQVISQNMIEINLNEEDNDDQI
eukprot:403333260